MQYRPCSRQPYQKALCGIGSSVMAQVEEHDAAAGLEDG